MKKFYGNKQQWIVYNNFITRIVHLFRKIRKVINKIWIYNNGFLNGTGTDMCICLPSCNFGEHVTNVTRFYASCVVLCRFFFFLVQVFLNGSTISSQRKDPMSSDVCGSLYKSVNSSLYLFSNFRLSSVAVRTMTYTGFLVHLVLLGSVGTALILIALQFLCLFQVSTVWCDLFLVEDDPLHEDLD